MKKHRNEQVFKKVNAFFLTKEKVIEKVEHVPIENKLSSKNKDG